MIIPVVHSAIIRRSGNCVQFQCLIFSRVRDGIVNRSVHIFRRSFISKYSWSRKQLLIWRELLPGFTRQTIAAISLICCRFQSSNKIRCYFPANKVCGIFYAQVTCQKSVILSVQSMVICTVSLETLCVPSVISANHGKQSLKDRVDPRTFGRQTLSAKGPHAIDEPLGGPLQR